MNGLTIPLGMLPGVRQHVGGVQRQLSTGRSCLWLLTTAAAAPARLRQLLDLVGEGVPVVEVKPPPSASTPPVLAVPAPRSPVVGTVEEMLRGVFGPRQAQPHVPEPAADEADDLAQRVLQAACTFAADPVSVTDRPLVALAQLRPPGGVAVVVRADDEHEPASAVALVRRYSALVRDYPPSADRPVLLVVGSVDTLLAVEGVDPLSTGVHWWWGVFSRLDLLTVAVLEAAAGRGHVDELCADLGPEVITEVAGPDVDLAAELAREWDGSQAHLGRAVRAVRRAPGSPAPGVSTVAGTQPAQLLRERWSAGDVDSWGGRVHQTLRSVPAESLDRLVAERLWIGQARALNPLLDGIRRAIVDIAREHASATALADLDRNYCNGAGVEAIELNDLRKAVRQGTVRLDDAVSGLLDHAVGARNALAHRRCVDDHRLLEISRLVPLISAAAGH